MTALRAEQIHARTVTPLVAREPSAGEVRVTCPACDWSALRPAYAVPSAREAHRIAHAKGWIR